MLLCLFVCLFFVFLQKGNFDRFKKHRFHGNISYNYQNVYKSMTRMIKCPSSCTKGKIMKHEPYSQSFNIPCHGSQAFIDGTT